MKQRYDITCPSCGTICHRTNGKFDPDKMAVGEMFELKDPWKTEMWTDFTKDEYTIGPNICCIECGTPYPGSDLRIDSSLMKAVDQFVCQECGKVCKSKNALNAHAKAHRNAERDTEK